MSKSILIWNPRASILWIDFSSLGKNHWTLSMTLSEMSQRNPLMKGTHWRKTLIHIAESIAPPSLRRNPKGPYLCRMLGSILHMLIWNLRTAVEMTMMKEMGSRTMQGQVQAMTMPCRSDLKIFDMRLPWHKKPPKVYLNPWISF